jgi:RNA polymerase sigma-B factor
VTAKLALAQVNAGEAEPQLSDGELAQLFRSERCEQAREALVCRYGPMVRALVYRYQLPAQYYEDLLQVGYLGLVKAINNFDPSVCEDLRPYAHACVSGEIKRFFRDKRWLMRVSRHHQELLLRARRAQADLAATLGGLPTDDEVANHLNVSADDLRRAYQAHDGFAPESLDAPLSGPGERETGDLIGADDTRIDHTVDMDAVRLYWGELPWVQRQILLMRFYGNMTQQQVADRLQCSQMHVSRSQTKALAFLRSRLLAD